MVDSDLDRDLDKIFYKGVRVSDLLWDLVSIIETKGLIGVPANYRVKLTARNKLFSVYEFTITYETDDMKILARVEYDGNLVFKRCVTHKNINKDSQNLLKSSEDEFSPIPGAEYRYKVSRNGQVLDTMKNRLLQSVGTSSGHMKVVLVLKDGRRVFPSVHRLVALTYLPNPRKLPIVNHKNGIKTDNRVENLEWASGSFNNMHANRYGLSYFRPRIDNSSGYVGISKNTRGGYIAYINSGGKRIHGGTFEFLGDAIDARERLKQKYHLTDEYLKQQ